ncbi:MAG: hypothetical protein WCP85_26490 [Mariniphaga sp.]
MKKKSEFTIVEVLPKWQNLHPGVVSNMRFMVCGTISAISDSTGFNVPSAKKGLCIP